MRSLLYSAATVLVLSIAGSNGEEEIYRPTEDPEEMARHDLYGDPINEEKAVCNVCKDIVVPAVEQAVINSQPNEHWRDFVEDVIHALPKKYRYDMENHEPVEHDDAKHGLEPCRIVQDQIHEITYNPHTHASVAALGKMWHYDDRMKTHLKRMTLHSLCTCIDDITKEDKEFDSLIEDHMHATDRVQHEYELHFDEYDHNAPTEHHEHRDAPKEEVKPLTKQELEEMQWEEDQERHQAYEHGDHPIEDAHATHQHPDGTHGIHGLRGEVGAPEPEGDDLGDHEANIQGLGIGHGEL